MKFFDVLNALLSALYGIFSLAIPLFLLFILWGAFNGFNWDVKEFFITLSIPILAILGIAGAIWFILKKKE
ncbi:hypothetical protein TW85_24930 [Marinomonas sp. S3726]|uniref:hypothetical protein n=1 Tax=Marinomonas sp. S3726 TaxID=579484 RepID=UPI0005F9F7F7|nr:hypothetical protein [Marinomonas sp. S3726]KJZ07036.1 hypothetical protein TW85_24930 [Marinomonas sp. S3726]